MANETFDSPLNAGLEQQRREYFMRRVAMWRPDWVTKPDFVYGNPEMEYYRLVNEGVIPIDKGDKGEPGSGFGRFNIGNRSLNTLYTPGLYQQNDPAFATPQLGYPINHLGLIRVEARLLDTEQYGPSVLQVFTPITGVPEREGQVHYERTSNGLAGWSAWRSYVAQRVDNSAGRTIYTWDNVNNREQMIYGDTGWRNVSNESSYADALRGQGIVISSQGASIRRVLNQVFVRFHYTKSIAANIEAVGSFPTGWRSSMAFNVTTSRAANDVVGRMWVPVGGNKIVFEGPAGIDITGYYSYITDDPWPSSLPGIAG